MLGLKKGEGRVVAKGAAKGVLWVPPVVLLLVALTAMAILLVPAIRALVELQNHRRDENVGALNRVALWQLNRSSRKEAEKGKSEAQSFEDLEQEAEAGVPAPAVS